MDMTPEELLRKAFPVAAASLGPLVELVRNNPSCADQIIALAMVIGIRSQQTAQWRSDNPGLGLVW